MSCCVHVLLLSLMISSALSLCLNLDILTSKDTYLQNNLLGTTRTVNVMDCAAQCQSYQQCQSFGFKSTSKSCHLHGGYSDLDPSELTSKSQWIHGNLKDWPKTLWGPCADHQCPVGQRCHVNRMTRTSVCTEANLVLPDDLCPVPPGVTNAVLSPGGQEIAASRTYTCQYEYLDTQSFLTSAVTTCLPDNTWAPVNLTCSGLYTKFEFGPHSTYTFDNIDTQILQKLTGSTSSLKFFVKTCYDCNFVLHTNENYNFGSNTEIAIGGWQNTYSVIRQHILGEIRASNSEDGILSCTEFRPFWLSWAGGVISLGKGNTVGMQEFLSWETEPPFEVNYVGYSAHVNNMAVWYFFHQV